MRQHRLEALLEITAVFGAGQQRAHIQRIDSRVGQHLGDLTFHDHSGQALRQGGLAHPRLAYQQGVVLAAAAQDLNDAFDFMLAPDQGIDLILAGQFVEVGGEVFQGGLGWRFYVLLLVSGEGDAFRFVLLAGNLGDAVGNIVDDVQAGDVLLMQQINGLRILLAEDRHQHIGAGHLFLAR